MNFIESVLWWGLYLSSGKENRRLVFTSFIKRVTRTFHVVFVQRRQRNVQKNMMHVLSCCFADLVCLLFCRSRCRRRRRCLSSLFKCTERKKTFFRVACRCLGHVHPVRFQSSVARTMFIRFCSYSPLGFTKMQYLFTCSLDERNKRITHARGREIITWNCLVVVLSLFFFVNWFIDFLWLYYLTSIFLRKRTKPWFLMIQKER